MNRTGLTLSAVAATLVSLPAAAMLLGLPSAASASATTAPSDMTAGGVTTSADSASCDWTPSYGSSTGHPANPLAPNGKLTDAGWDAGAGTPAPALTSGIAPDADGSWRQVSPQGLPNLSIAGDTVNAVADGHGSDAHYGQGSSPCDWTPVYHIGDGHAVTALSSTERGRIVYAAWTDRDRDHGQNCGCGIATNYGGRWHQLSTRGLPKLNITGITVDPLHLAHAYAVFNESVSLSYHGSSRCGCGDGHVYETWNAGLTWTNISGNLPKLLSDVLLLLDKGKLALATNDGVFTAFEAKGQHTCWVHLGAGLPRATVEDLTVGQDNYIYAATHGHGTWRFKI